MNFRDVYFIQTNIICIIFLLFISARTRNDKNMSVAQRIYHVTLYAVEIMCLFNIVTGITDSKFFPGVLIIAEIAHLGYFICGAVVVAAWFLYICISTGKFLLKRWIFINSIPCIIFTLIALSNPFTKLIVTFNEENHYIRGPLVFVHWIVVIYYLLFASCIVLHEIKGMEQSRQKEEYINYMEFVLFPVLAFILQIFFPGSTIISSGAAIGFLFIYIRGLEQKVSEDGLTGLKNRNALDLYIEEATSEVHHLFTILLDMNDFKKINDRFGHLTGDKAIADVASIIKKSARHWKGSCIACRYGGDEFLIVGIIEEDSDDYKRLIDKIYKNLDLFNANEKRIYTLSTSIGYSDGTCSDKDAVTKLINDADQMMYEVKNNLKKNPAV